MLGFRTIAPSKTIPIPITDLGIAYLKLSPTTYFYESDIDVDGNIISVGRTEYSTENPSSGSAGIIVKMSPLMSIITAKLYYNSSNDDMSFQSVTVDSSGNYVVLGYSEIEGMEVIKFDSSLNIIAGVNYPRYDNPAQYFGITKYGTVGANTPIFNVRRSGAGCVVSSIISPGSQGIDRDNYSWNNSECAFTLTLNSDLSRTSYAYNYEGSWNFFYGSCDGASVGRYGSVNTYAALISTSALSVKKIIFNFDTVLINVIRLSSGDFVAVGYGDRTGSRDRGIIVKFSSSEVVIATRLISDNSAQISLYDIVEGNDGDLMAVGTVDNSYYIAKINPTTLEVIDDREISRSSHVYYGVKKHVNGTFIAVGFCGIGTYEGATIMSFTSDLNSITHNTPEITITTPAYTNVSISVSAVDCTPFFLNSVGTSNDFNTGALVGTLKTLTFDNTWFYPFTDI